MPRLVLEFAVRAALIAIGTAAVLGLLRVKSAGARHAAWAGVTVLMLLLPVWTAWGPRATVRMLPPVAAPAALPIVFDLPALPPATYAVAQPIPRPSFQWTWRMSLAAAYLLGAFILLGRLALGTLRARALLRQSVRQHGWLTNASCATPITVGWLHPAAILPAGWRQWPQAQLDAVLTHEGEHVRRRDPLMQWVALLNRAIFWFHPLAWWLERHLSALAEEACDAAVLTRGHDPYDYSGYLLELARSVGRSGVRVQVAGMAMPGSSLPQRIRQIVSRGPAPQITRAGACALAIACLMVSAVFAAATVDRQQFVPEPPLPPTPPVAASIALALPAPPPPPRPLAVPAPAIAPQAPAPPVPPAAQTKYHDKRLIALYFDSRGASLDLQIAISKGALNFVQKMAPSDLIAIMSSNDGTIRVLQDFTDDHDQLAAVIGKLTASTTGVLASERMAGLETAFRMLSTLPEKKSVVYFTLPVDRNANTQSQLEAVINEAVRSNVAIYPIDARGVVPLPPSPALYRLAANDQISVTAQEFSDRPSLRNASSRPMRRVTVKNLGHVPGAVLLKELHQFREPSRGLFPRLERAAIHLEPGADERSHQPGPDGALMVGAVAATGIALVPAAILRVGGR